MVLDMLIVGQLFQYQTQYLPELRLALGLHVAANVLGLYLQLPLKAGILLAAPVYHEHHRTHVEVHRQLERLSLLAREVQHVLPI
jgi:hypothetical protein